MMIVLSCVMKAKKGKETELEKLLKSLFPKVKEEEGVLEYALHQVKGEYGKIFFYEKYKDQSALDYHNSTPYVKQLFAQLDELLDGKPELAIYDDIYTLDMAKNNPN